jgi:hypothetical protein
LKQFFKFSKVGGLFYESDELSKLKEILAKISFLGAEYLDLVRVKIAFKNL